MAFVRIKSLNPSKIILPLSGNILEIRCSNDEDYQYMMGVYINSTPDDFAERFLQRIMISGKTDINSLPFDDLKYLFARILEQEGKCSSLSTFTDKGWVFKAFRDEIIGVPYSRYNSKKDKLKEGFKKECDKWLKTINILIDNNSLEKDKLKSNADIKQSEREKKLAQLNKNIENLEEIKEVIFIMKKYPEVHILQVLQTGNLNKNNFDQSFNFIRLSLKKLDPQYIEFPFRWCGFLPSDEFNRLYRERKQGKDVMKHIVDSFQEKYIEDFIYAEIKRSTIDDNERKEIIFDGLKCFYEKKYSSSIVLLLPQIEGLLWELAKQFNNEGKFIYEASKENSSAYGSSSFKIDKNQELYYLDNNITKHYTEVEQKDLSILSRRKNNKDEIKIEDIGTLLKETAFRFYLYADFINYFCDELYNDRNEILHGRILDFGTKENAIKKILALLMILNYY